MKLIGRSNRITRLLFFGIVTLVLSQSVSPSTSRTITTEYLRFLNFIPVTGEIARFNYIAPHTLSDTETNKIFHRHAQTPTCYFTLTKYTEDPAITVYDKYT